MLAELQSSPSQRLEGAFPRRLVHTADRYVLAMGGRPQPPALGLCLPRAAAREL